MLIFSSVTSPKFPDLEYHVAILLKGSKDILLENLPLIGLDDISGPGKVEGIFAKALEKTVKELTPEYLSEIGFALQHYARAYIIYALIDFCVREAADLKSLSGIND